MPGPHNYRPAFTAASVSSNGNSSKGLSPSWAQWQMANRGAMNYWFQKRRKKKRVKKNESINFGSQYVCRSMVPPKFSEAGFGLQDILVRKDKCRYSLVATCAKSLVESKWAYPESISRTPKRHVCPTEPSYSKRKPGLYNLIYIYHR